MEPKTYTFLFTDIEGSTRLWEHQPKVMSAALAHHNVILTDAINAQQGKVFKTVGDGFCAVFDTAEDALIATLNAQQNLFLAQEAGDVDLHLRVRMGLHTGRAEERDNDYFGSTLNRVARLMGAANGWQILVSGVTRQQILGALPDGVELRDLGQHRLKDIREPEHLYQVIAPEVRVNYAPIRTLSPRPTNLPAALTSFIGRETEEREIARRLRRQGVRLLTLTGPGGIGKTRLSLQVGIQLRDDFEDGVFFVDLAPLAQASAVVEAIAGVLNVEENPSGKLIDALKAYLHERHVLLILDNFEHVMDAAPVINTLLAASERLSVLVTGREALRIYGEQTFAVLPLAIPAGRVIDVDAAAASGAVRLFVDRVQAVKPDFVLTETSAQQVVDVCRYLDGLPLALELAAARVSDLDLADIVEQLNSRLTLLTQGPRDVSSRQQTVRGTIDWSYEKLAPDEQQAFAALAVFAGRFTGDAAIACIDEAHLANLARKSLVQVVPGSGETSLYLMLETLREYARERLVERGELEAVQRKHADYYGHLVETAEPHLTGATQLEWFQQLEEAHYNLLAALHWALPEHDPALAGRIVAVLWRHWSVRSRLTEGSRWVNRVLEQGGDIVPLVRARILYGAGRLELHQYHYSRAQEHLNQALALYQAENDPLGQAAVHVTLGETLLQQNDVAQSERHFLDSLALYRELNDHAGLARSFENLGRLAARGGNFEAAQLIIEESLALTRVHGTQEGLALALNNLAEVLRAQQKYVEAAASYRESLDIYRQLEFKIGVAVMLHNLGQVELPQKNYPEARLLFLGALDILKDIDDRQLVAECLAGLAGVFLHTGEVIKSARYLGAAKALLEALGTRMDYADYAAYEQHIAGARAQLGDAAFNNAWDDGQAIPVEQMITETLRGFGNNRATRTSTAEFRKVEPPKS